MGVRVTMGILMGVIIPCIKPTKRGAHFARQNAVAERRVSKLRFQDTLVYAVL